MSVRELPPPAPVVQASAPIREITFSRSPEPAAQPALPVIKAQAPVQKPELIQDIVVVDVKDVKSENAKEITYQKAAQKLEKTAEEISSNIAVEKAKIALPLQKKSNLQPAIGTPTLPQPDLKEQPQPVPIDRQQDTKTTTETTVQKTSQPELKKQSSVNDPVSSERIQERQKVIEKRLAEIVAKNRAQQEANRREILVTNVYESVSKGKFDQARQLLADPIVPATVQQEVTKTITSLETTSRKVGVVQATEPIRTALKQRQLEQRQKELLRSVPSLPPLPARRVASNSSVNSPVPIRVPQPIVSANSDRNYSVTTPADLQAFNPNLSTPGTLGENRIGYPLPTPVPVTSKYGWRVHPVSGSRRFHAGVDLGAGHGTPVLATRDGKVKLADTMGGYGLAIVVEHSQGKQDALYAHLSQLFVRPGEVVKVGSVIGRVGSTGLSTGPHLHYETRRLTASGWTTTDPGSQLEAAKVQLEQALASARNASLSQTKKQG
ncbi:MAG: M23 family metallopeptidase [Leptolyngbyaceae cyanobacterium CSU_1_3]|nr:M23 family metallopeptidase [Leptolyngbyaceae cyanobacterium CSU_1_3]